MSQATGADRVITPSNLTVVERDHRSLRHIDVRPEHLTVQMRTNQGLASKTIVGPRTMQWEGYVRNKLGQLVPVATVEQHAPRNRQPAPKRKCPECGGWGGDWYDLDPFFNPHRHADGEYVSSRGKQHDECERCKGSGQVKALASAPSRPRAAIEADIMLAKAKRRRRKQRAVA